MTGENVRRSVVPAGSVVAKSSRRIVTVCALDDGFSATPPWLTTSRVPSGRRAFSTAITCGEDPETVTVTVSGSYPHLIAALNARLPDGTEEVVSQGGIALKPSSKPHAVTIKLLAFATTLPAGTKLSLTFSPVTTGSNVVYLLSSVENGARITIGKAALTLPVLQKPISS